MSVFLCDEFGRGRLGLRQGAEKFCDLLVSRSPKPKSPSGYFGGGLMLRLLAGDRFALHGVAIAPMIRATIPMTAAPTVFCIRLGRALVEFFLRDQRLPVGDRDLVVVWMDFRKRQKAVAVAAVVDKGRLK